MIQQTIATVPGQTYTVTFKSGVSWQAANGNFDARIKVEALNGTTSIAVQNVDLPANKSAGWSTYTMTFTATSTRTTLKFTDTSPNGQANFDVGLDSVSVLAPPDASAGLAGQWDALKPWPLVGIHAVITQDGKLLTFGTDINGVQGSKMYHDLYDPVTGQHHTINHQTHTPTNIFCSAAIIIPGTNQILITGGDTGAHKGVNDTNFFDNADPPDQPTPDQRDEL